MPNAVLEPFPHKINLIYLFFLIFLSIYMHYFLVSFYLFVTIPCLSQFIIAYFCLPNYDFFCMVFLKLQAVYRNTKYYLKYHLICYDHNRQYPYWEQARFPPFYRLPSLILSLGRESGLVSRTAARHRIYTEELVAQSVRLGEVPVLKRCLSEQS